MANEKRLIDADKIYDAVERRYQVSSGAEHRCERDLLDLICAADTVDATVVVRCKDCKSWNELNGKDSGKPVGYGYCRNLLGINGIAYEDSFCSYGESKDNGC